MLPFQVGLSDCHNSLRIQTVSSQQRLPHWTGLVVWHWWCVCGSATFWSCHCALSQSCRTEEVNTNCTHRHFLAFRLKLRRCVSSNCDKNWVVVVCPDHKGLQARKNIGELECEKVHVSGVRKCKCAVKIFGNVTKLCSLFLIFYDSETILTCKTGYFIGIIEYFNDIFGAFLTRGNVF